MSDTNLDLTHLPIATHHHGRKSWAILLCGIFTKADGAATHHWIAERPRHEQLTTKRHASIARPNPGPGKHLVQ